MKPLFCILFSFILISVYCSGGADSTGLSKPVLKLCRKLEKDTIIQGEHVGFGGITPPEWYMYTALRDSATTPELLRLSAYPSPVVKAYAMLALIDKKSPLVINFIKAIENDSTKISTLNGCLVGSTELNLYLVREASDFYKNNLTLISENDMIYLEALNKQLQIDYWKKNY